MRLQRFVPSIDQVARLVLEARCSPSIHKWYRLVVFSTSIIEQLVAVAFIDLAADVEVCAFESEQS